MSTPKKFLEAARTKLGSPKKFVEAVRKKLETPRKLVQAVTPKKFINAARKAYNMAFKNPSDDMKHHLQTLESENQKLYQDLKELKRTNEATIDDLRRVHKGDLDKIIADAAEKDALLTQCASVAAEMQNELIAAHQHLAKLMHGGKKNKKSIRR